MEDDVRVEAVGPDSLPRFVIKQVIRMAFYLGSGYLMLQMKKRHENQK